MSTSTVGFAVADEDQERLARLVEHFGHGNRSAYLRATLPVMESLARAERLRELQARNTERAAAAGEDYESLLTDIRRAYKRDAGAVSVPGPEAVPVVFDVNGRPRQRLPWGSPRSEAGRHLRRRRGTRVRTALASSTTRRSSRCGSRRTSWPIPAGCWRRY